MNYKEHNENLMKMMGKLGEEIPDTMPAIFI